MLVGLMAAWPAIGLGQGKGETVVIQDYPGIGNMLFRIAVSKGYCAKHGITCRLQMIPSGPLGAQALLAKSIDVGFFPPEVQINAMIKGARLKAVMSGATLNTFLLVARNDLVAGVDSGYPAIMTLLKGKKIGVPARAAAAEMHFVVMARHAGFRPEDFTFVAVGASVTAYGALLSRQVDANMTFEPSGAMCDVLQTCTTVYRGAQAKEPPQLYATNGASSNIVVTEDRLERSPGSIEAMIAAARDAEAFIQAPENFDAVVAIANSFSKLEMPRGDEVMTAALRRTIPQYKVALSRGALKAIADNMLATGQIDAPFDATRLAYDRAP